MARISHDPKSPNYVVVYDGWHVGDNKADRTITTDDREAMTRAKRSLDIFAHWLAGYIRTRYPLVQTTDIETYVRQYDDKVFVRRGAEIKGAFYEAFVAATFTKAEEAEEARAIAEMLGLRQRSVIPA